MSFKGASRQILLLLDRTRLAVSPCLCANVHIKCTDMRVAPVVSVNSLQENKQVISQIVQLSLVEEGLTLIKHVIEVRPLAIQNLICSNVFSSCILFFCNLASFFLHAFQENQFE